MLTLCLLSGCQRESQTRPESLPAAERPAGHSSAPLESRQREAECPAQAGRVAAHEWGHGRLIGWQAHYSPKYDHCYVLLEYRTDVANEAAVAVSELWDAFEARVLAEHTRDRRPAVERAVCQVTEDDDPFTSCAVSGYFISQHMTQ